MEKLILIVHVLAASGVIGLVLLQHGKGADMGAAFGSGASGSLFGVSGSSNLLSKLTAGFVTLFFITSISLGYLAGHRTSGSVVKGSVIKESAVKGSVAKEAPIVQEKLKENLAPAETKSADVQPNATSDVKK